jgi:hypothetical protein
MPNSGYPFAAKVGQIKPPNWANSEYRKQLLFGERLRYEKAKDEACQTNFSSRSTVPELFLSFLTKYRGRGYHPKIRGRAMLA